MALNEMALNDCTLVLGIGSDHGDDQAGWLVTETLAGKGFSDVQFKQLRSPFDLIDSLDDVSRVHLVDAAAVIGKSVMQLNFDCRDDRLRMETLSSKHTHDFGVYQALQLAETIGRRTDHVSLWLVAGSQFGPLMPVSASTQESIRECARMLGRQLALSS